MKVRLSSPKLSPSDYFKMEFNNRLRNPVIGILILSFFGTSVTIAKPNTPTTTKPATVSPASKAPVSKSPAPTQQRFNGMFSHIAGGFGYSYTDFNFDSSTVDGNYNRFKGTSNLYSLLAENLRLSKDWAAGVAIFKVDTSVTSFFRIGSDPSTSNSSTHNYTLFAHATRRVAPWFSVDMAGAYGQNKIKTQNVLSLGDNFLQYGVANTNNNNWFASIMGTYSRPWKNWQFSGSGKVLYSQVDSPAYPFVYPAPIGTQVVASLTNKVTYLTENVEVGYRLTPLFMPFLNGGLIQVASFSNSRPIVGTVINGTLPQLNMDKNAYKVGGGLSYNYKQFAVRLEEQYYNAGGTFTSTQTILLLRYQFG